MRVHVSLQRQLWVYRSNFPLDCLYVCVCVLSETFTSIFASAPVPLSVGIYTSLSVSPSAPLFYHWLVNEAAMLNDN